MDEIGKYVYIEYKGIIQRMRWIEPGEFLMGSPGDEPGRDSDEFLHKVKLTKGFWLADTVCTQEMWQAVMGKNPSNFKGKGLPVEQVSWEDCQEFITKLNEKFPDYNFRLPTEAEWEYACRAGTTTPFSFGDNITTDQVNYDGNYPIAVKSFPCNTWGLYEMHGNVWEWCQDWYGEDYYRESPVEDPPGPAAGISRVLRGGCWFINGWDVRSAVRDRSRPGNRHNRIGFRLALSVY
jgi:sulfatase modifying factor 1